jgi:acyl-CoA thioesterase I
MIVMACPPFAWAVDVSFLTAFVLWYVPSNQTAPGPIIVRLRFAATGLLVVLLLVFPTKELSHRKMPRIAGNPGDHLVVIGDSISTGIDPRIPAWPVVMQQMTGVAVKNLALPGTNAIDAKAMAARLTPDDTVALIEIGGNDLLSGEPSAEISQALAAILSKVTRPGRSVVMFELPLLPHKIEYGQIQRQLAAQHGVALIPKRYFTEVIRGASSTSDGLHLSKVGAHRMAALVAQALCHVLTPPLRPAQAHP